MSNNKLLSQPLSILALIVGGLTASGSPNAAEIESEFNAGYMVSDNIFLVSTDVTEETEENIRVGGMSLILTEETNRIFADIQGVVDYLDYDQTFEPEWIGGLAALVEFTLVDEYLNWIFQENYGQRRLDPFAAPDPSNRENVNFFTTGPNIQIPFGGRYFAGLEGRYSTVKYEESINDNERTSGLMQFGRRSNTNAIFSINAEAESVTFDNDGTSDDFDIYEAFIAYDVSSSRNIVNIQLGYTELDICFETADGHLIRADWTRISSESQQFLFSGGSQYSTQGDLFRYSQSNGRDIGDTEDVNGDDTPFRSHFLYTRYDLTGERTTMAMELEWNQDDYDYVTPTPDSQDRDILR